MLSSYGVFVNVVCPGLSSSWDLLLGYTDTPILDTNTGKNVSWKLSPQSVAQMTVHGLERDYSVIECDMLFYF